MQQERKQALEKMGISVQSVGISVQKNKFYLVNLNADPSLNEMLVYYLKVSVEHTFDASWTSKSKPCCYALRMLHFL